MFTGLLTTRNACDSTLDFTIMSMIKPKTGCLHVLFKETNRPEEYSSPQTSADCTVLISSSPLNPFCKSKSQ